MSGRISDTQLLIDQVYMQMVLIGVIQKVNGRPEVQVQSVFCGSDAVRQNGYHGLDKNRLWQYRSV